MALLWFPFNASFSSRTRGKGAHSFCTDTCDPSARAKNLSVNIGQDGQYEYDIGCMLYMCAAEIGVIILS
jgi:hypothetical protein